MRNKLFLIFIIFLQVLLILVTYQLDTLQAKEVQAYRYRLATLEGRYLAEKQKQNHNQTRLDLALAKGIIEDKDKQLQAVQQGEYIGEFEVTYYTVGEESTGKTEAHPAYGITKSGTTVEDGRTIAADWDVLPQGSRVWIEGVGIRIVEDTGGAIKGNKIDVYEPNYEVAMQKGRHPAGVWVLGGVEEK